MKVPDGSHGLKRACGTRKAVDIGRASQYEQVKRQLGLLILAAIAEAHSAEQSAFINVDDCVSSHVRLL